MGRAVVREPSVFLFDEPLSNLDAKLRVQMRLEVARLHKRLGVTILYVTHDQVEAMTLADRIAVMNLGRLQQCAPPNEVYQAPANTFVATFIGSPAMNLWPVQVIESKGKRLMRGVGIEATQWPDSAPVDVALTLGIRPQDLSVVKSAEADLALLVDVIEPLGAETFAYGTLVNAEGMPEDRDESTNQRAKAPWIVRFPADHPIEPGQTLHLRIDRQRAHLFDLAGERL